MKVQKNEFFERDSEWMEEFNSCSVNWVDRELLQLIISSLNISQNQFMRFIGDSKKWVSKITDKNFKIHYHYLRDAADFLAIPPWFLFYRNSIEQKSANFNKEIIEMFSCTPPKLPIFEITWKNEAPQVSHVHYSYETPEEKADNFYLRDNLGDSNLSHYSYIKGDWKDIFDYLKYKFDEGTFSGSGYINSENTTRYTMLGTLRIKSFKPLEHTLLTTDKKFIDTRGGKGFWKTAWFSVDLYLDDYETKKREIEVIIDDVSYFFGQYPWMFSIINDGKIKIIYSWHSLRKKESEIYKIEIVSIIEEKMKEAISKLQLSIACNSSGDKLELLETTLYENDKLYYKLFKKYIKDCIERDTGQTFFSRRKNTLPLLFEKNYLQEGSLVKLKHNVEKIIKYEEDVYTATVINDNGTIKLKWHYDNHIYYITPLTEKIIKEFNIKQTIKQRNGNVYWGLSCEEKSLEETVKQVIREK